MPEKSPQALRKEIRELKGQLQQARQQIRTGQQKQLKQIEVLLEIGRIPFSSRNFISCARKIFRYSKKVVGARAGYVALLSPDGTENNVVFLDSGGLKCTVNPDLPMPIRGLRARAYRTGKPVCHNDFHHSDWKKYLPKGHVLLSNVLFAPMVIGKKAIGLVGMANKKGGFTAEDLHIAAAFAKQTAMALVNYQTAAEKRGMLEELERSETRFRTIVEHSQPVIFSIDRKGIFTLSEGKQLGVLGLKPGQVVGMSAMEVYKDYPAVLKGIRRALKGQTFRDTITVEGKNGPAVFDIFYSPLRTRAGKVTGLIGMASDITRMKEQEIRFRMLFETVPLGIVYQDGDGKISAANPAAERILGLTLDQMQGRTSMDPRWRSIGEDGKDISGDRHPAMVALRTGKPVRNFIMGVDHQKSRETRWLRINAIPQFRKNDKKPWQAYAIFEDITGERSQEKVLEENEQRYRALSDNMRSGVAVYRPVDKGRDFLFADFNQAARRMGNFSRKKMIGQRIRTLFPGVEKTAIFKTLKRIHRTGRPEELRQFYYRDEIREGVFDNYIYPLPTGDIVAVYDNVTEKVNAEAALESELTLNRALAEMGSLLISQGTSLDEAASITLNYAKHLTGSTAGFVSIIDPQTRANVGLTLTRMMAVCRTSGKDKKAEFPIGKDGTYGGLWGHALNTGKSFYSNQPARHETSTGLPKGHIPLRNYMAVPILSDNKVVGEIALANTPEGYMQAHLWNVDQLAKMFALAVSRQRTFTAIRVSEKKYRELFDNMMNAFALHRIIVDDAGNPVDYEFLEMNAAFERMTGLKSKKIIGKTVKQIMPGIESDWIERYGKVALTGKPVQFENYTAELDRWYSVMAYRPQPGQFAVLFDEITERKKADGQIKASLEEKDVLLQEIHHRVKNNMQIISSLLLLQGHYVSDQKAVAMLNESRDRIRSMATIHEMLYRSKDFGHIDFQEYINTLIRQLYRTYQVNPDRVKLVTKIQAGLDFGLQTSIHLGLIINEIVSNVFKYAFPDNGSGTLTVGFTRDRKNRCTMTIRDDGVGLPEKLDIHSKKTLGFRLITMLAEDQLEGTLDINRKGGTAFVIRFTEA